MKFDPETITFMKFLKENKKIRDQIKARDGCTLVYSGNWKTSVWTEIDRLKKMGRAEIASKDILADVLRNIVYPGTEGKSLYRHVDDLVKPLSKRDRDTIWLVLSGIYVANAVGPVSFAIGGDVASDKIFVTTELPALLRNRAVMSDAATRELLEFCQRCVQAKNTEIIVSYLVE